MSPVSQFTAPGSAGGDVGRRIAHRREEAGLSRAELARAVGADPSYLRYIEEENAAPGTAVLLRIAAALGVNLADLRGTAVEYPQGRGGASAAPVFEALSEDECRARLAEHGVGRVGLLTGGADPQILPVNYCVVDGDIAFRTGEDTALTTAEGERVAFEVDRIDDALSAGWSVLVTGAARRVREAREADRLERAAFSKPWADPGRAVWFLVHPDRLSGRRIRT
ncbi:pyridoxamine 5'-phosphate oxidase family protein [Streptomyces sp. NPDC049954]|uniref:helix-turn-helix domain-containing protein n=1 Tax=Streptomyces sp. NPDC049954 TaxID=3155779 RepID=UPI00342D3E7C